MSEKPFIVGAGLAGLLCACAFPRATIFEAGEAVQQHRALLRFRDESVSKLTGVPFKAVRVYKEIWDNGQTFRECSNKHANMYALKVTGSAIGRSIRDLAPVTRYVAPDDFYQQLVDRHAHRITWQSPVNRDFFESARDTGAYVINTAPLPTVLPMLRDAIPAQFDFERRSIHVVRIELDRKRVNVYQTVYYPGDDTAVYRASITGNIVIIESMMTITDGDICSVFEHFGLALSGISYQPAEHVEQRYGKIKELKREAREALLYELTRDHNIFSIGRFATWRNILLDDVVQDIEHVKRLMKASHYGRALLGQRV